ncbi:MAG: ABC transporter substrate-binding protein [Geminicoccaceae bacterium]|nr:ABC transporter substrate-binding protein [Geminicoccaceae bacterium]
MEASMNNGISLSNTMLMAILASVTAALPAFAETFPLPRSTAVFGQDPVEFVAPTDILHIGSLPEYREPAWVTERYVKTGLLPPVSERLPKEPLIYNSRNMYDGIGVYGGTLRHVTGGRPQGWNKPAGQHLGFGGTEMNFWECLTATGPLYQVKGENLEPLPNLARSWQWSDDGHELTMQLIEGIKWSDGDPFDSEDVLFLWEDHILDPNIASEISGTTDPKTFGIDTKLEATGAYEIKWTFRETRPTRVLFAMAYPTFCPGPSHVMKSKHPRYNKDMTYESYQGAFPVDMMNFPVLGSHVAVDYTPDEFLIARRNPYYWKVDETGQQLPYMDEVHYRFSTWTDRTERAVNGTADWSNLENLPLFAEAIEQSTRPDSPARINFGPRTIGYFIGFNYAGNDWGHPDRRARAIRKLNRILEFRLAVTHAIDRERLNKAISFANLAAIYPGGIYVDSIFGDADSTVYYPYSPELAKENFAKAGLFDTDGDGYLNYPAEFDIPGNVEINVTCNTPRAMEPVLAGLVIGMLDEVGLKLHDACVDGPAGELEFAGKFEWSIYRGERDFITFIQDTRRLAPIGPRTHLWHQAGSDGTLDLLPFENDLVSIIRQFYEIDTFAEATRLASLYQKIFTENVYQVGLTVYPGGLIVNKRLRNIQPGTPVYAFQWAEKAALRERLFVPAEQQVKEYERFPGMLPGSIGMSAGRK